MTNLHFETAALWRSRLNKSQAEDLIKNHVTDVQRDNHEFRDLMALIKKTEADPLLGNYTGLVTVMYLPTPTLLHTHTFPYRLI